MKSFSTINSISILTAVSAFLSFLQFHYDFSYFLVSIILLNICYLFFSFFLKKRYVLHDFFFYNFSLNIFFYFNILLFFSKNLIHIFIIGFFLCLDFTVYCLKTYMPTDQRNFHNYVSLINKFLFLFLFFCVPQNIHPQILFMFFSLNFFYLLFQLKKKLSTKKTFILNFFQQPFLKKVPHYISFFRIFFTCIFFFLYFYFSEIYPISFFIFYVFLSSSDFFDGYLARKFSVTSVYGQFFDIVGDKFLLHLTTLLLFHKNFLFFHIFLFTFKDFFTYLSRSFYGINYSQETTLLNISGKILFKIPGVILYVIYGTYLYPFKTLLFIPKDPYIYYLASAFSFLIILLSLYLGFHEIKRLIQFQQSKKLSLF